MIDTRNIYKLKIAEKEDVINLINKRLNIISLLRLLFLIIIISSIYFYDSTYQFYYISEIAISLIVFVFLIQKYIQYSKRKELESNILKFYNQEKDTLEHNTHYHDSGNEFIDSAHLYTYDLDIFGKHSLFEHINRTHTYLGKVDLAETLIEPDLNQIIDRQIAINELSSKLDWRARFYALSFLSKDSEQKYKSLQNWLKVKRRKNHRILDLISFSSPLILLIAVITYLFGGYNFIQAIVGFNLIVFMLNFGRIKSEILNADQLHKTLFKFSDLLKHIENEKFGSSLLKSFQAELLDNNSSASNDIKQLANIYEDLNNAQNLLSSIITNSLFLYHIHTLRKLDKWNDKNLNSINKYLEIIAKFDSLNSLSNFAFNNSEFVFARISSSNELSFKNIKHPLILKNECVANSIHYIGYELKILTGSNMSGKSTFLRATALNILLANIGSVCAAEEFTYKPLRIASSMRNNDSISAKSSYFYSEVMRLQKIYSEIKSNEYFIFLDEILKGTNSDDKREGTKDIIRKFLQHNFYGIIATHDIEVCEIENEFNSKVSNICFEVEIINNELKFDYKLKPNICKNKSASFLINKYIN